MRALFLLLVALVLSSVMLITNVAALNEKALWGMKQRYIRMPKLHLGAKLHQIPNRKRAEDGSKGNDDDKGPIKFGHPLCVTAEFNTSVNSLLLACGTAGEAFAKNALNEQGNVTAVTEAYTTMCDSACHAAFNVFDMQKYGLCLDDIVPMLDMLINVGCKANSLGEKCGINLYKTITALDLCENHFEKTRECLPGCDYNKEGDSGSCTQSLDEVRHACHNECVNRLIDSKHDNEMTVQLRKMCTRSSTGKFCFDEQLTLGYLEGAGFDNVNGAICTSPSKFECVTKMTKLDHEIILAWVVKSVADCIGGSLRAGMTFESSVLACNAQIRYVQDFQQWSHTLQTQHKYMCSKNSQGKWCGNIMEEIDVDLENTCFDPTKVAANQCANCQSSVRNFVDQMGCCLGLLFQGQQSTYRPSVDDVLLMAIKLTTSDPNPTLPYAPGHTSAPVVMQPASQLHGGPGNAPAFVCNSPPCELVWNGDEYVGIPSNSVSLQFASCLPGGKTEMLQKIPQKCAAAGASTTPISTCYNDKFVGLVEDALQVCIGDMYIDTLLSDGSGSGSKNDLNSTFLQTACNSPCIKAIASLKSHSHCLPQDMLDASTLLDVACSKDEQGSFCGLQMNNFASMDCDNFKTSTTCATSGACRWSTTQHNGQTYSYCEFHPKETFLTTACTSCVTKFATALRMDKELGDFLALFSNVMCAKEGNKFCYPSAVTTYDAIFKTHGGFAPAATISSMCNDSTTQTCFRRVANGFATFEIRQLNKQMQYCVDMMPVASSQPCIEDVVKDMRDNKRVRNFADSMCMKNSKNTYCMGILAAHTSSPCFGQMGKTCSDTCNTLFTSIVNDAGCCMGTISHVMEPALTPEDLPKTKRAFALPVTNHNATPPVNALPAGQKFIPVIATDIADGLSVCASLKDTIVGTLHIGCDVILAPLIIKKEIAIPVAWKEVQKRPEMQRRLVASMVTDLAASLGKSTNDFKNPRLVEDRSHKVKTNERRMQTQAEEFGTKLEFDVQTASVQETQAISQKFDTQVASNELKLETSSAVVSSDCSTCLAAGATTLNSEAAFIAPTPAPSGVAPLPPVSTAIVTLMISIIVVTLLL